MDLLNLSALPLEAVLLHTRCHLTVWQKTHTTDSKLEVCLGMYAAAPYFQIKDLPAGSVIYVDGLKRLYLLLSGVKYEIQIGKTPFCLYGDKAVKYPHAQLIGTQKALQDGKLGNSHATTSVALAAVSKCKAFHTPKVNRSDYHAFTKDADGNPFDASNHALWADRAPGIHNKVELGTKFDVDKESPFAAIRAFEPVL